jgi:hypothetical protein
MSPPSVIGLWYEGRQTCSPGCKGYALLSLASTSAFSNTSFLIFITTLLRYSLYVVSMETAFQMYNSVAMSAFPAVCDIATLQFLDIFIIFLSRTPQALPHPQLPAIPVSFCVWICLCAVSYKWDPTRHGLLCLALFFFVFKVKNKKKNTYT